VCAEDLTGAGYKGDHLGSREEFGKKSEAENPTMLVELEQVILSLRAGKKAQRLGEKGRALLGNST